ncbi:hypothetical protein D9757_004236 [Collybiopsis confluens]|uniref:Carbohydrate-binding module family 13 protein n=1 Tax=Collybiopsis confluens TaxID=2823264 RepID=A0A8H5MD80_9AGAR|nr:hypothetical protein D9757_004236 [Collybiopsis confluens]
MSLRGAYFIHNARVPIAVNLNNAGATANGTTVVAWEQKRWDDANNFDAANQMWLIKPVPNAAGDVYTVQNIKSGTFLDLHGGSSADKTPIVGWEGNNSNTQKWIIKKDISGAYRFQNVASNTFMDLYNGGSANGTEITGWSGWWESTSDDSFHKRWSLKRASLTSAEVSLLVRNNPDITVDFKSYQLDGDYIILPEGVWQTIWNGSGLHDRPWRSEIFDCDDFAVVYKGAVATWGAGNVRADGIAILCGIMLGRAKVGVGAHAYNFNINTRFDAVRFFEPQTNAFQDHTDYNAYLGFF